MPRPQPRRCPRSRVPQTRSAARRALSLVRASHSDEGPGLEEGVARRAAYRRPSLRLASRRAYGYGDPPFSCPFVRDGSSEPSGWSTNSSAASPSTAVSIPLMKAFILRPVSRSTGSPKSDVLAYWKYRRVSRSRSCSPALIRLRSAGVSVSSSMQTSVSLPAQKVRARVGPRPNCSLYRRTISVEISARTLLVPACWAFAFMGPSLSCPSAVCGGEELSPNAAAADADEGRG